MASARFGKILEVFGDQLELDSDYPCLKEHRELDCGCSFGPWKGEFAKYDWHEVYGRFCDKHALALGKDVKGLPLRQMALVPELRLDLAGTVIGGFDHYRQEKIAVEVVLELGATPGDTYLTVTFPADPGYERDPEYYAGTYAVSVAELAATQEFTAHRTDWINEDHKRKWVLSWMLREAVEASDRPGIRISVQAANRVIAEDPVLSALPDHEYYSSSRVRWVPQTVVLSCGCSIEFHGWPATELGHAGGSYAVLSPCEQHAWQHYHNRLVLADDGLPQWPECSAKGTAEFPPCGAVFFPSGATAGEAQQAHKVECRTCPLARVGYYCTRKQYGKVLNWDTEAPWLTAIPDPKDYRCFLVVQKGGRGCHPPSHPSQDPFAGVCYSQGEAKRLFLERTKDPHGPKAFLFRVASREVAKQAVVVWMEWQGNKTEDNKARWQEVRQRLA